MCPLKKKKKRLSWMAGKEMDHPIPNITLDSVKLKFSYVLPGL